MERATADLNAQREKDTQPVVKPELGTKRSCPSCQTRFYDLGKEEIVCPNCGVTFVPEQLLPSKADQAAPKARVVAEPVAPEPEAEVEPDAIKADAGEPGDDEIADVEDVGEDTELADEDEFLEEVEEDAEVSDLIGGTPEDEEP
jgi:uncharacterized protein (TIGR02300 family)